MVHSERRVEVIHEHYAPQPTQMFVSSGKVGECSIPFIFVSVGMPMQACPVSVLPSQTDAVERQLQPGAEWAAQPYPMAWPTTPHPGSGEKGQLEWNYMAGSTQVQLSQACGPCNANPKLDRTLHLPPNSLGSMQSAPTCITSLQADLKAGGEAHRRALAALLKPGKVRNLSFQKKGCWLVQSALGLVERQVAAKLALDLRGSVVKAVRSPHANYVIQKILAVLTPREAPFVVAEISKASLDLACHEYGCRIFCRLLEQAAEDAATRRLVDELLCKIDEFAQHEYGHHLIECALEHGLTHQRSRIVSALQNNLWQHAWSRYGSYVLVKALQYCDREQQEALSLDLLAWRPDCLAALAASQYGNPIVRALMDMPEMFVHALGCSLKHPAARACLMKSTCGKRLGADLDARLAA